MIVKMTKYTLVVVAALRDRFLARLQELGMVDVTSSGWEPSDEDRATMALIDQHRAAAEYLRTLAADKDFVAGHPFPTGAEALSKYENARRQITDADTETSRLEKTLVDSAPLGDFNPAAIRDLANHGVSTEWLLEAAGYDDPASLSEALPAESPAEMRARLAALETLRSNATKDLARAAATLPAIEADADALTSQLHLSRTSRAGTAAAEGSLVVMEAWARQRQTAEVDAMLEANPAVLYIKERPTPDDDTPVELHNAALPRPFEFIAKMYALPRYGTMDLTRWFAPFYMLFFAFCLADAGYGALLLGGGIFLALKGKGSMREIGVLSIYCGAAAVVFGFFAGSLFGINMKQWGIFANVPFFPSNDMFLFALALCLGIVQILFGMILKVITTTRAFGIKYALATIGWIIVIVSGIAMILPGAVGLSLPIPKPILWACIGIGAFMMLFLNNPGKNPLINFGGGLWNTYNDVTGFLSDALSYIRLFAIGLSGGVLAAVFNDLAIGMSPDIPVVGQLVTLIILLIGHGLNLFMSTLSSMVHPLRLTFVEFYKNAGFEASARSFTPLSKQSKNS
jgi:V/A-type H+-transporting ATPase subunit I